MRIRKHDIERYLRGELSPAEMHALEKEALNDPFLSEALEGIEHAGADNFLYDLHEINRSMYSRTRRKSRKNSKVIRIWGWTTAVAATLLVLIVSGFLAVYFLRDHREREQVAALPTFERTTDSLTIIMPAPQHNEQQSVTPTPTAPRQSEPPPVTITAEPREEVADGAINEKTADVAIAEATAERFAAEQQARRNDTHVRELSTGRAAIQEAPAAEEEGNELTEEDSDTLAEVVVIGYAAKKTIVDESAVPTISKSGFKEYLTANVKYPQQAQSNKIKGNVIIRFTVEPNGQLTNFEVVKGIGAGCEEELIRAIREGPTWKPAKAKGTAVPSEVTVRFRFAR